MSKNGMDLLTQKVTHKIGQACRSDLGPSVTNLHKTCGSLTLWKLRYHLVKALHYMTDVVVHT